MNKEYWESYYQQPKQTFTSSSFARYILSNYTFQSLIDFGCGNGRDTLYFSSALSPKKVLAVDFSINALFLLPILNNIITYPFDFEIGQPRIFYRDNNEYDCGYARFFLCAITDQARQNFYKCARYSIKQNGKLFIECRSDKGIQPDNTHRRNLINKDLLVKELEQNLFKIDYIDESNGFSPTEKEDPILIRCVASNTSCTKYSQSCSIRRSCCQDKLRDMLFDIVDYLEQEKITYWVDFGTLLGAVRNQDIISWDQDIDISIWKKDNKKIEEIENILQNMGYYISITPHGIKIFPSITNNKIWADIYYWNKNNNICIHSSNKFDNRINRFDISILGNFTDVTIYNRKFKAPEKYHQKLTNMYGNYMIENKKTPYWSSSKKGKK